jgi:hypothetical protein
MEKLEVQLIETVLVLILDQVALRLRLGSVAGRAVMEKKICVQ